MTSTHDLIAHIPSYMLGIISSQILGDSAAVSTLAENLSDTSRLRRILERLTDEQMMILMNIYELGGQAQWSTLACIFKDKIYDLKPELTSLGYLGFIFQAGLSGRDPIFILPSLMPLMEEIRQKYYKPITSLSWESPQHKSIWEHIILINSIRSNRIRCRSGMEPFKKGWEFFEEKLETIIDVRRVYWELVELGCLKEKAGVVIVNQEASMGFVMDGDSRYGIWTFLQSCKQYPGLESKVYTVLFDHAVSRDYFIRSLQLYLISKNEDLEDVLYIINHLIDQWIEWGVLQNDLSKQWLRLTDNAFQTFKTGKTITNLKTYSDEVIIQPDMEVLVPKDFDSVDHLNIGEIAELVRADVVSIYRISRESIFKALHYGWDSKKIEQFLDRISRHVVPENVMKTIILWCQSHEESHIIKGTFLILKGSHINKVPHGFEEILPGIYKIPEKFNDDDVTQLLDEEGLSVRRLDEKWVGEAEVDWGKILPLKLIQGNQLKNIQKGGIYPFGMVTPLPYGPKGEIVFEEALHEGRSLVIFYPKQGYGEIEVKRISPVYIYRKGGTPFVEAFCEDTGEGEVFDISKVRALLKEDH